MLPLVVRRLCETSPTVTWGNEMTRNRICFLTPSDERDQWSKIDRARRLESRFSTTLNPAPSPLALVFISQLPKKDARGPTVCSLAVHLCQDQTGVSAKERREEELPLFAQRIFFLSVCPSPRVFGAQQWNAQSGNAYLSLSLGIRPRQIIVE